MERRGINYTLKPGTIASGRVKVWTAEIDWPESGQTTRKVFTAYADTPSEAKSKARQWAIDRIDDYRNREERTR